MERIGLKANMSLKNNVFFIVSLAVMAFFMRVIIGTSYFNAIDLMNYNKGWMESLSDGLFDSYAPVPIFGAYQR